MQHCAVVLTLKPSPEQKALLLRHCGARRFAWNWCKANFEKKRQERKQDSTVRIPWVPFAHIDAFNRFKLSHDAGQDAQGRPGLPWRKEVLQQVFEEGAADFGKSVMAWVKNRQERKQKQTGRKVGVPDFKSKRTAKPTFRLRNNANRARFKLGQHGIEILTFGVLPVRESLRPLRRLLARKDADGKAGYIAQATFSFVDDHWRLSFSVRAVPCRPRHTQVDPPMAVGCDVGVRTFLTVASEDGQHVAEYLQPEDIQAKATTIRRAHRALSLKQNASRERSKIEQTEHRTISNSEKKACHKLQKAYRRQRNIRRHEMELLSTHLAETKGLIGTEDLHIAGMMKNRCLSAAIARQAWGELIHQLAYKTAWRGGTHIKVGRFFPSSKRCSKCHETRAKMPLGEEVFRCQACPHVDGRDINAASNIAQQTRLLYALARQEAGQVKKPEPA